MIVMPIPAGSKHYEKAVGRFIYRYGYQAIKGDEKNVTACVEEVPMRYKEATIKKKVQDYCAQVGIPDEWNPADYGYED